MMHTTKTILYVARRFPTLVAALVLAAGCAQDVGEIDRTQVNYVSKRDLEGEWFMRHTTVDAPYAAFATFIGDQGPLERGTFEVTESHVIFYRTYEFSKNSQTIGLKSDTDKPYLTWLDGDETEWTANPYQSRDRKFAQGTILPGAADGEPVACDGLVPEKQDGGMHEFCREATRNGYAYCGHEASMPQVERTHENARCVQPTKYVFTGSPLAAFPIEDHFDIIWSYNPGTGEKTNVREENSSDRFWYERQFMRVNWDENEVQNYGYSLAGVKYHHLFGEVKNDIIYSVFEGEAAPEEEQFRIFRDESDQPEYFDFVSRYILQAPAAYSDYYDSDIPLCAYYPFYTGGIFECTSEEVKTRTAFMRVNAQDDYRPVQYDDHLMEKFGFFRQERQVYDEYYYQTYQGVQRYIERWDIWDSHPVDADGKPVYADRNPVPVVYYLSEDFPRDLVPMANELAKQWSKPLGEVVAFHKGADSVPEGGMFVVCENNNSAVQAALEAGEPVAAYDHPACRDMDYVKHNGDLRYSFLYAVNAPAQNGLAGYGPPSADPLSGKIISASAYIYGANLRLGANRAADMVQLMTHYLDFSTLAQGLDISQKLYPDKLTVSNNPPPSNEAEARDYVRGMVSDNVRMRVAEYGFDRTDQDWTHMRMSMVKKNPELDRAMIFDDIRMRFKDQGVLTGEPLTEKQYERMALRNWANQRGVNQRRDLWLEYARRNLYRVEFADGALIGLAHEWKSRYNNEICTAVFDAVRDGEDLAFDLDDFSIVKDQCSQAQAGSIRTEEEAPILYALIEEYDPTRPAPGDTCMYIDQGGFDGYYWVNTCTVQKLGWQISHKIQFTEGRDEMEHWAPSPWYGDTKDPLVAASQKMVREKAEGLRGEMVDEFMKAYWLSVALHEVGHTLGLRHNFEASTDAMNFPQEYWDHKVSLAGDGKTYQPADLWTRETQYQQEAGMRSLQYSSIMDYGAKFNSMWNGLGHYDHAAIKFGYGNIVEVFDQTPDLEAWEPYLADPSTDGLAGDPGGLKVDSMRLRELFKRVHYTQIPNVVGSVDNIYKRRDVSFDEVRGARCEADAECGSGASCRAGLGGAFCTPDDLVEVPYRFCSDEYAGRMPYCDVWDEGADAYEIVRNTVDDYWWYWPFWGHWRGSVTYHTDAYESRIMWAFNRLKRYFQYWAIDFARFNKGNYWEGRFGVPWDEDLNGGLSGAMATAEAFNTLINVFAIPDTDGSFNWEAVYAYNSKTDRYEKSTAYNYDDLSKRFVLEQDYGKFSPRPVYGGISFAGDDILWTSGGAIFDRVNAFIALTDPTTDLLNIDETPDARKYMVSFFTLFPDKMIRILGGLTTHRESLYAGCVVEDSSGKPHHIRLRDVRNADDPDFCADGKYMFPEQVDYDFVTTWYRIPMLAAYFGMSLMINDYDRRFMDATRIFLKGHEDGIELPADAEVAEFQDPMTGKTYVAYKVGDENVHDIAYYLVKRAQALFDSYDSMEALQAAYQDGSSDLQHVIGLLELIRGLHKQYDYTAVSGLVFSTGE